MAGRPLAVFALSSIALAGAACSEVDPEDSTSQPAVVHTAGLTSVGMPRADTAVPKARAEVVGVMVARPTAASTDSFERLGFAGTFSHTRLSIQMHNQAGGIIDLLRDDCRIEWFGDDQGTDLVDPEEMFGPIEMMPDIAEDGRSLVFIVGSKRSPHPKASRLEARGTLAVVCASQTERQEARVSLQKGAKFALGSYEFEVTATGKSQWSDGWTFELTSKQDLSPIVQFSLVTDGSAEELQRSMSMSGAAPGPRPSSTRRRSSRAPCASSIGPTPPPWRCPSRCRRGWGCR